MIKLTTKILMAIALITASPGVTKIAAAEPTPAVEFSPVTDFVKLPEGWTLGACSAVAVSKRGEVYLFHRGEHPIICCDSSGRYLRHWGDDLIGSAHGLRIDRDENVWVTDIGHHRVHKFDPQGKLLLTLGTGQPGNNADQFNKPTDIAFGAKGEFYVTDGYGNGRVMKFSPSGALLHSWGKIGKGQSEFRIPHSIVIDNRGRILVGDRENDRIQLFDAEGQWLDTWSGFAPYGLALDGDGRLFVADGRAQQVLHLDESGRVTQRWGKPATAGAAPGEFNLPHMLAFDAAGNLLVAEIGGQRLQKLIKKGAGSGE